MATPKNEKTEPTTEVVKPPAPPAPPAPTPSANAAPDVALGRKPTPEEAAEDAEYRALDAARRKLEALRRKKEIELIEAEIAKLEAGGLTPTQARNKKKSEELREATFKETLPDGKVECKYIIPFQSYKGGALRPPGYVITLPFEQLPGAEWKAVKKVPEGPATQFAAA